MYVSVRLLSLLELIWPVFMSLCFLANLHNNKWGGRQGILQWLSYFRLYFHNRGESLHSFEIIKSGARRSACVQGHPIVDLTLWLTLQLLPAINFSPIMHITSIPTMSPTHLQLVVVGVLSHTTIPL